MTVVEIRVEADPLAAFERFEAALEDSELRLEHHADGELVEDGREADCGLVTVWQPGHRFEAVWPDACSVAATFEPAGEETRVLVELEGPAAGRYERLWRGLLDDLARRGA